MNEINEVKESIKFKPQIVLTLLAQEYGLTVEDLMERFKCAREDVIVEKVE